VIIPTLELGFWNAWILALPMMIIILSDMRVTSIRESGKGETFQLTRKENLISFASLIIMFFCFIYPIFLPLYLRTVWLYSGLIVFLFGLIFAIIAVRDFATSPKNKVITQGLYGFSRNPVYIGLILMQTGISIACISWLYFILTIILLILLNSMISSEERFCLYLYGENYQRYLSHTPRWIGLTKLK